ncbi:putative mitochondrial cytochrome b2 [Sporormia fimetaria CBS 119925]|uniref:L-lactate dehydrogenase (cytochrome) n=1 Tax=Sporormia fimetaria CBS 119925 TaxID=1340428 RepID=A0A6A6V3A2_9PLEO|nr:putative mitochondrial cytochrome b2 [Sporormia fimetaria CBS 119925]
MADKLYTHAEVAKHNSSSSCWVILYGKIYDATSFISSHPGGPNAILRLAGTDATSEYDPIHAPGLLEENASLVPRIGILDTRFRPSPSPSPSPSTSDTTPPIPSNPSTSIIIKNDPQKAAPHPNTLLNLHEFAHHATRLLSPKARAYYTSAADDLFSKDFNHTVYTRILLRPRIFRDCTICTTSTTLLSNPVSLPLYISPAALARLAHPSGEAGIAAACAKYGIAQVISHNASMRVEDIVAGHEDGVFGYQIYIQQDRKKSEELLTRVNALRQIKFLVLTLDAPVPGKREDDERQSNLGGSGVAAPSGVQLAKGTVDVSKTSANPETGPGAGTGRALFWGTASDLTWKTTLPWLARHTDLPIILKGIQTHEDAYLAALHAPLVKGIVLSNHGGRALDTAPPAVHTLLEIRKFCPEVFERVEVWVDGGIRRGTDVVKALCLGARGVGIGRAALFGLAVGGMEGVERVVEILKAEIETAMRLLGVERVEDLGPRYVNTRVVEREIFDGDAGLEKPKLWSPGRNAKL